MTDDKTLACDGRCGQYDYCSGEVRQVDIRGQNGRYWGTYYYCEAAIQEDAQKGYMVIIKKEAGQ